MKTITNKEIGQLRKELFEYCGSQFPLNYFFNDIEYNMNSNFDADKAYNDLRIVWETFKQLYAEKEELKNQVSKLTDRLKSIEK